MKAKGFTLIELLAVIVILAIIALIATPIILGIIEDASDEAIERSVENYLKAINIAVAKQNLNEEFDPVSCTVKENEKEKLVCTLKNGSVKELPIEVDGEYPEKGKIKFKNGSVDLFSNLFINDKYVNKDSNGIIITNQYVKMCKEVEKATLGTKASTRSDYATVEYKAGDEYICDPGDGIQRTFYVTSSTNDTVSLIAGVNIGSSVWINESDYLLSGGSKIEGCSPNGMGMPCATTEFGPVTALKTLKTLTSNWDAEVSLPSVEMIAEFAGIDISNVMSTMVTFSSPQWLFGKYWTSTSFATEMVWQVGHDTYENVGSLNSTTMPIYEGNIRPIITIQKNEIKNS